MTEDLPRFKPTSIARLTVVGTVYFQPQGDEAMSVGNPFSRQLSTDEQPYVRTLRIGEEWVDISKGSWLEGGSMICISNDEGKHLIQQQTPEEKKHSANKILEVAFEHSILEDATMHTPDVPMEAFALVLPTEDIRFTPAAFKRLRIRCRKGAAKCTISLFPE